MISMDTGKQLYGVKCGGGSKNEMKSFSYPPSLQNEAYSTSHRTIYGLADLTAWRFPTGSICFCQNDLWP